MSQKTRWVLYVLAFLCLSMFTTSASAETTEEMLSSCRPMAAADIRGDQVVIPHRSEFCWGAFATVQKIIGMILAQGQKPIIEGGQPTLGVCAPPSSNRTQLIAVFVAYAGQHPERLHEHFLNVALDALRGAFPC